MKILNYCLIFLTSKPNIMSLESGLLGLNSSSKGKKEGYTD